MRRKIGLSVVLVAAVLLAGVLLFIGLEGVAEADQQGPGPQLGAPTESSEGSPGAGPTVIPGAGACAGVGPGFGCEDEESIPESTPTSPVVDPTATPIRIVPTEIPTETVIVTSTVTVEELEVCVDCACVVQFEICLDDLESMQQTYRCDTASGPITFTLTLKREGP